MIDVKVLGSSSKGNCYRVTDGTTPILLECGIRFEKIQQGLNFKISEIAGCLVTHEHKDHSKAIKEIAACGIDIYTSQGTQNALNINGHRVKTIKAKEQFRIGAWVVLPFETQHDAKEPLGFLLQSDNGEKLLFATDTYYVRYKFNGLTHIMVECNYAADILKENVDAGKVNRYLEKRLLKSHFSLENVKEFLKANDLSKVKEIWLLHLSESNGDPERFKREIQELTGKPVYIAR